MTAAAQRGIQGRGAYPLRVAAAYARLPAQTVGRWVKGYDYKHRGQTRHSDPVSYLAPDMPANDDKLLDFEQLLTLLLVKAFKSHGLGLATIKKAAAKARAEYDLTNPFISKHFRTDGNKVFLDLKVSGSDRKMIDVLGNQHVFQSLVEPSLFRDVVFVNDRASEWWPMGKDHHVVVAPSRQFGAPHIQGKGVRTDVVAQMVAAEGGEAAILDVASWYGLTSKEVMDAVEFEGPWLQRRA